MTRISREGTIAALVLLLGSASVLAQGAAAPAAGAASAASIAKDPLTVALSELTSMLATYVAVLAGTSALVVAVLEATKKLFSLRGKFHRTAIIRWLSQDKGSMPSELDLAKPGMFSGLALGGGGHYDVPAYRKASDVAPGVRYDPVVAYAEFFHLTSGQAQPPKPNPSHAVMRWRSVDRAVFELETSRLMSQIQDAADAVLNNPTLYPHLYAFFTRGSNGANNSDAADWKAYIEDPATTVANNPAKKYPDVFARVRLLMRRQLDAFQIVTACRWGDLNQWWAMVLGAALLFVALVMAAASTDPDLSNKAFDPVKAWNVGWDLVIKGEVAFWGIFLKALLGGALAPVAKDLLNSLSSIKFSK
jgi:hypothetical protein